MTKKEFIRAIANEAGLDQKTVKRVLTALQTVVKEKVKEGEKIIIRGFIQFYPKRVKSRLINSPIIKGVNRSKEYSVVGVKLSKHYKIIE